uniref:AAA-type ATPase N-terminal domain-containing protein n=1 Tax=Solanum lycopersicum TaxID=4081 RepID=A0A3Q7FIJ3_SOLLC
MSSSSRVGLVTATIMLVPTIIHNYIPRELHAYLFFGLKNMFTKFSNQLTMVIDEFDGLFNNKVYEVASIYLANKLSPQIHIFKFSKTEKEKNLNITMKRNEVLICTHTFIYNMIII